MRSLQVNRDEVMAVSAPEFTDSWHPIAHGDVLRATFAAIRNNDLAVKSEEYGMTKNGNNLFTTLTIDNGGSFPVVQGTEFQLGVRNSISKAMAIGMTAGTRVMVCSNMCFSGDYLTFRKHTSGLSMDELYAMADRAVASAIDRVSRMALWQESLKETPLNKSYMKLITYDAMKEGAVPPSKFNEFIDMYKEEEKLNGDTVYTWHGAGTRLCRNDSLINIAAKTPKLTKIAKGYVEAIQALG
jgi:hypothetical protein